MARMTAASAALMLLLAVLFAPPAAADDGRVLILQGGTVRCALSADNVDRGGGPMAVCERANGQAWGMSPWETSKYNQRLNLAIVRGTGEMYWERGTISASNAAGGLAVTAGQPYQADGWTATYDGFRTRITNDATRHGIFVTEGDVRQF
ncbi:hypothetical protein ABGB19_02350 [Mycobacterium sp. B14F4]|uniref:hypothetical protein n=1 Tax=Mycobacterium sp. B14F4 TaxID=3153565 RepID=UPI00325CA94A